MKRTVVLVLLALALCTGSALASGTTIGVMPYGGYAYAVLQDDTGSGAIFGVRAPVGLSFLTLEPFYANSSLGDRQLIFLGSFIPSDRLCKNSQPEF